MKWAQTWSCSDATSALATQSVQDCALLAKHRRIDILVNCAGAHIPERIVTLATDAYTKGKLALGMFTRELGERLEGTGVTVSCLTIPGSSEPISCET